MQRKISFVGFVLIVIVASVLFIQFKKTWEPEYHYNHYDLNLNFEDKKKLSKEKLAFMEKMVRSIQYSNYKLNKRRARLEKIEQSFRNTGQLNSLHLHWLKKMTSDFSLASSENLDSTSINKQLHELDLRVQMVPLKLALAQGILESAWGTSRFAKDGKAYFGIHCYSEGCGMKFGNGKKKIYVKTYHNMHASVEDYMSFLNTKRGPYKFRTARLNYYSSEDKDIKQLAQSLDSYSEIGGEYQKIINSLFRKYIPDEIDDF